jgi:chromosome partitioning protein
MTLDVFVGIAEIASLYNVSSAAVTNWRKRFSSFPQPVETLKAGPVFRKEEIEKWYRRKYDMSNNIVATINLKGGVGKTTTTVGLGQVLSGVYGKRVLIIDLDPQTNATTMLIGEDKWFELDSKGYTLATLFSDAIYETSNFDLEKTLQVSVGDITEVKTLDLLPSSLRLIELQDRLMQVPAGPYGIISPVTILRRGIRSVIGNYDYVLIDCPPNLGFITLNGVRMADGYIIPTIPDVLSTYGIPQIVTRIGKFSDDIYSETGHNIVPFGIVATKVRSRTSVHGRTIHRMRGKAGKPIDGSDLLYPKIFDTFFIESAQMAEAAEYQETPLTLRQKWGYSGQYVAFEDFAKEFIQACKEN